MALADISFTNNLGTLTFKRAMLSIADEYQWNGRNAVRKKQISIEAMIDPAQAEDIDGLSSTVEHLHGTAGTLTLPWTVLTNVKFNGLDSPVGNDVGLVPVTARFSDDTPINNMYTLQFFGVTLHNPRLTIPVPAKSTADNYIQTPVPRTVEDVEQNYGEVKPTNPWYGPTRYKAGFGMMQIQVTGTLFLEPTDDIKTIIAKLHQRIGVGGVTAPVIVGASPLPNGHPRVFTLAEAIPTMNNKLKFTNVFIIGARLHWNVERRAARVTIQMLTQPQKWS